MATKLRMRKERKDEVRLTVEDSVEDELKMSHQEIAVWIDCQARWSFPPDLEYRWQLVATDICYL